MTPDHLIDIENDDLWPRDDDHRYRLYARDGTELRILAASPTLAGVCVAIGQLDYDCREAGRRLADEGQFGILDVIDRRWLVLPWNRGGSFPFSEQELRLIAEALDSHEYWQLSDETYRDSGYVLEHGSDDPEHQEQIRACRSLLEKVERMLPKEAVVEGQRG